MTLRDVRVDTLLKQENNMLGEMVGNISRTPERRALSLPNLRGESATLIRQTGRFIKDHLPSHATLPNDVIADREPFSLGVPHELPITAYDGTSHNAERNLTDEQQKAQVVHDILIFLADHAPAVKDLPFVHHQPTELPKPKNQFPPRETYVEPLNAGARVFLGETPLEKPEFAKPPTDIVSRQSKSSPQSDTQTA